MARFILIRRLIISDISYGLRVVMDLEIKLEDFSLRIYESIDTSDAAQLCVLEQLFL